MRAKTGKTNIKIDRNMKNVIFSITLLLALISCSKSVPIKNTKWNGIDDEYNKSILFCDSTCEIYISSRTTGHTDTLKSYYKITYDTISFVPFNEYVSINSKLIITKQGLKESKSGKLIFKQSEK